MYRILSNGLVAVGLAAVVAFVALMSGTATKTEAAPTAVSVVVSSTTCGVATTVTATVTDGLGPQTGTSVAFSTSTGSITASSATVGGVATASLLIPAGTLGTVTVTATTGGISGSAFVNCGGGAYDPCVYNASYCNCTYNYNYNCGNTCAGTLYNQYNYNCGANNCGTLYNAYYGGACVVSTGCNYGYYNSGYTNLYGYNYNNLYGCGGGCTYSNYTSCIPATCANVFGPILNCSNIYTPPGNVSYIPGRVSILPGSSSVSCGSATSITVTVADPNGLRAPDGTLVNFTTTLGYISASDNTTGGTAVTSLTIPPGTSGSAKVTASAGGQSADTTINVTCASGAPQVVVQPLLPAIQQAIQAIRPIILPPSTGDGGLASD